MTLHTPQNNNQHVTEIISVSIAVAAVAIAGLAIWSAVINTDNNLEIFE